jgi:UDP-GlcNAc:undecaprenyl-phosphate GlcNAc-1-phosphate transferase
LKTKVLWHTFIGVCLIILLCPWIRRPYFFDRGLRWPYLLFLSFLVTYFITPFSLRLALRFNTLDNPDWRKIHDRPTPLLGGLAVYLGFSVSLLVNDVFLPDMKILLFGATLIFLMGLWDDIRPLSASLKLLLQILISLLVIVWGEIYVTLFYGESWAPIINIPLTVLWIVGLTNALNFFDGIDGLASGISVVIALFLGLIAFKTDQPALGWVAVTLLGASAGFMPYNFRIRGPALLFLGDAGSTFLGFSLAVLAISGKWSVSSHFVSFTAPILVFGILIFDMVYVNLSRIKNRKAGNLLGLLTCVNKDHLHHRLLFLGFTRKETVFVILTMSTCLGFSALIVMNQKPLEAVLGLFQALLILALIVSLMLKGRDRIPPEGDRRLRSRRREDRM